jgi:hypothetical protein
MYFPSLCLLVYYNFIISLDSLKKTKKTRLGQSNIDHFNFKLLWHVYLMVIIVVCKVIKFGMVYDPIYSLQ